MKFYRVYLLVSEKDPNRFYAGFTENFKDRLVEQNSGKSIHTRDFRPWRIKTCIAFTSRQSVPQFEHYLKTSSDRSFAKKRL